MLKNSLHWYVEGSILKGNTCTFLYIFVWYVSNSYKGLEVKEVEYRRIQGPARPRCRGSGSWQDAFLMMMLSMSWLIDVDGLSCTFLKLSRHQSPGSDGVSQNYTLTSPPSGKFNRYQDNVTGSFDTLYLAFSKLDMVAGDWNQNADLVPRSRRVLGELWGRGWRLRWEWDTCPSSSGQRQQQTESQRAGEVNWSPLETSTTVLSPLSGDNFTEMLSRKLVIRQRDFHKCFNWTNIKTCQRSVWICNYDYLYLISGYCIHYSWINSVIAYSVWRVINQVNPI